MIEEYLVNKIKEASSEILSITKDLDKDISIDQLEMMSNSDINRLIIEYINPKYEPEIFIECARVSKKIIENIKIIRELKIMYFAII